MSSPADPAAPLTPRFVLDVAVDAWDDPFHAWACQFRAGLAPTDLVEEALVEQLIMAAWRLRKSAARELTQNRPDPSWARYHGHAQRDWSRALADWNRHRKSSPRLASPPTRPEPVPAPPAPPEPVAAPPPAPEPDASLDPSAPTPESAAPTAGLPEPARPKPVAEIAGPPDPSATSADPSAPTSNEPPAAPAPAAPRLSTPPAPAPVYYHGAVVGPPRPGLHPVHTAHPGWR